MLGENVAVISRLNVNRSLSPEASGPALDCRRFLPEPVGKLRCVMSWMKDRDSLIAQTMAFVQSVTGRREELIDQLLLTILAGVELQFCPIGQSASHHLGDSVCGGCL